MFERFTERARQVVVLAQDEARVLKHNYIGTEHLLLGLMREEQGLAARVLEAAGVELETSRARVSQIIGHGDSLETGQIPFTPRSKKVLDLALQNALRLGHSYVGTEHILIGLLHEGGGVAISVLEEGGTNPDDIWDAVHRELGVQGRSPRPRRRAGVALHVSSGMADGDRSAWLYDWWPPMVLGAGLFAGGLAVGWAIWG